MQYHFSFFFRGLSGRHGLVGHAAQEKMPLRLLESDEHSPSPGWSMSGSERGGTPSAITLVVFSQLTSQPIKKRFHQSISQSISQQGYVGTVWRSHNSLPVCVLHIILMFPPIYIQHDQSPCRCLLLVERRTLWSQTTRPRDKIYMLQIQRAR